MADVPAGPSAKSAGAPTIRRASEEQPARRAPETVALGVDCSGGGRVGSAPPSAYVDGAQPEAAARAGYSGAGREREATRPAYADGAQPEAAARAGCSGAGREREAPRPAARDGGCSGADREHVELSVYLIAVLRRAGHHGPGAAAADARSYAPAVNPRQAHWPPGDAHEVSRPSAHAVGGRHPTGGPLGVVSRMDPAAHVSQPPNGREHCVPDVGRAHRALASCRRPDVAVGCPGPAADGCGRTCRFVRCEHHLGRSGHRGLRRRHSDVVRYGNRRRSRSSFC